MYILRPAAPKPAHYFYRLRDDSYVREFCVLGGADPDQAVETLAPDGTTQRWPRRDEGALAVFHAPDGYDGNQGLMWVYDRRLQAGSAMPREELERQATRMRTSVVF